MSSMFLPDGSVVPAHMSVSNTASRGAVMTRVSRSNSVLRRGYICARHYPQDPGYGNNTSIVYDVLIYYNDGSMGDTGARVPNVQLLIPLGNYADRYHATMRCPASYTDSVVTAELMAQSTRVLVAFIDGFASRGVIIGCLHNPYDDVEQKDDGNNSFSSFNGVETSIDKNGKYKITNTLQIIDAETNQVKEADDPSIENFANSYLHIYSYGDVQLGDGNGTQIIQINPDKDNPDTDSSVTIAGVKVEENSTKTFNIHAGTDLTIDATDSGDIHAGTDLTIDATDNVYIGSTGATEPLVLGNLLVTALTNLSTQLMALQTTPAIPGTILTAYPAWSLLIAQWAANLANQILSTNKFTEKS